MIHTHAACFSSNYAHAYFRKYLHTSPSRFWRDSPNYFTPNFVRTSCQCACVDITRCKNLCRQNCTVGCQDVKMGEVIVVALVGVVCLYIPFCNYFPFCNYVFILCDSTIEGHPAMCQTHRSGGCEWLALTNRITKSV